MLVLRPVHEGNPKQVIYIKLEIKYFKRVNFAFDVAGVAGHALRNTEGSLVTGARLLMFV
jgi:hypothetical protein